MDRTMGNRHDDYDFVPFLTVSRDPCGRILDETENQGWQWLLPDWLYRLWDKIMQIFEER